MENVVSLTDVVKTYVMGDNEVHALRGISFDIRQGEFVSIMGPSGSGKSTCMNMIGCLDRPTSGTVKINGRETALMNERQGLRHQDFLCGLGKRGRIISGRSQVPPCFD